MARVIGLGAVIAVSVVWAKLAASGLVAWEWVVWELAVGEEVDGNGGNRVRNAGVG